MLLTFQERQAERRVRRREVSIRQLGRVLLTVAVCVSGTVGLMGLVALIFGFFALWGA